MSNKCPKCGYEYGEFDIFCARCGHKIPRHNPKNLKIKNNVVNESSKNNSNNFINLKFEFFHPTRASILDNSLFNFLIYIVVISCFLIGVTYFALYKHDENQMALRYRNLVNNPQQIPELKEPASLQEFVANLADVENFLELYLKYSKHSTQKKEQVFTDFINELAKLPHITNENLLAGDKDSCYKITSSSKAKFCSAKISKDLKSVGVNVFSDYNVLYLYSDSKYIKRRYSKYLSPELKDYLSLKAKYNIPVSLGVNLYIKPKKLADKIADFEYVFNKTQNEFVKESTQDELYNDFRKFIFTPSIYETTTHEMRPEFKSAYIYFISSKRNSSLRPVVMSYMDKQKSYGEDNFTNDYPYKIETASFEDNVINSTLHDVFLKLRKNMFSQSTQYEFAYIYNALNGKWYPYKPNTQISQGEYVITKQDENNNISIFNNAFSLFQELNILKYSELFIVNNCLYIFNKDKLSISKILFNGKTFMTRNLSATDVISVFPGVEVINIDSYSSYNILIEKDNKKEVYILLSRYSQGFSSYILSVLKGEIKNTILPNMFAVDSLNEVVLSFHSQNVNPDEMSESTPSYRLIVRTRGVPSSKNYSDNSYIKYDEKTAEDEEDNTYVPNIMPKIIKDSKDNYDGVLPSAPSQKIDPPVDDKD